MKLEFLYTPISDLREALALYRDGLGWEEAWREGESTVSLRLPGTDVQVMLDLVEGQPGPDQRPGPVFVVDSVARFTADRPPGLRPCGEPTEIPGGFIATYEDPSGNPIYVMDQSTDGAGTV
jgi:catechol 2,3-dioxygenase-like lactoylglutathione lyase family enzyme